MDEHKRRYGVRLDHGERMRKREARAVHARAKYARKVRGLRAKLHQKKRYKEKVEMKRTIKMHEEKNKKHTVDDGKVRGGAVPAYLLERDNVSKSKVLSSMVKQKRKEKAGKWALPIPKVKAISEDEIFKVIKTGKRRRRSWKRMITKVSFVGPGFTRKPPKYERFIRPMALRFKKAHVTHPELQSTFYLDILGVKKNPQSPMYTSLGIITKGAVIEVNVQELGMVTKSGSVVWGSYAQVTNNPELDGCINAILLV